MRSFLHNRTVRRRLAAALALLWALYAVVGSFGLCRPASAAVGSPTPVPSVSSASAARWCPMCHTLLRPGEQCPCCAKNAGMPVSARACLMGRCGQAPPEALTPTVSSWPVVRPPAFQGALSLPRTARFAPPGDHSAVSASLSPHKRPPCFSS